MSCRRPECRLSPQELSAVVASMALAFGMADEPADLPKAYLDGTGTGWRALGENDFANVNAMPAPGPGKAISSTARASRSVWSGLASR